jgi:hypothetical protein
MIVPRAGPGIAGPLKGRPPRPTLLGEAVAAGATIAPTASRLGPLGLAIALDVTAAGLGKATCDHVRGRDDLVARHVVREAARCAHAPAILGFY